MEHSFNVEIAKEYGIVEAILLKHIYYWILKNKANNKYFYDDNYWTYNSTKAFAELFPYLSERQVKYALKKLVDLGIIIKGKYNQNSYDKTNWYAITKFGYSIIQKCSFDRTKLSNRMDTNVQPIPDINTNINTDINNNNPIIPSSLILGEDISQSKQCDYVTSKGIRCSKKSKIGINGKSYCGQHARIELNKHGYSFTIDDESSNKLLNTYFENEELDALFKDFLSMRKKIKAVNSDRAITLLINKLSKYDDKTKIKMIENSIENSWKGIYELKEEKKKPVYSDTFSTEGRRIF